MYSQISEYKHKSVLLNEVLDAFECKPGQHYLDLTLGGGGHAQAVLELTKPRGLYWGVDRDTDAIAATSKTLEKFGSRIRIFHMRMSECKSLFNLADCPEFSGALIDCGVSSHQLDTAERGFSFRKDGPLDMRMDLTERRNAFEFINQSREEEIANVLYELGEEHASRRIAKKIVHERKIQKIATTSQLADIVRSCFPKAFQFHRTDPATKTFQAIRIFINAELEELKTTLNALVECLPSGARIAVITFHSLEDRIVKHFFKNAAQSGQGKLLTKKPILPSDTELEENSRSRSAKLRCFEVGGDL